MQMAVNILQILRRGAINITGNIQVILVFLLNLVIGNEPGILGVIYDLLIECGNDFVDVPLAQAVLVAILYEVMAGIDHKNALTLGCIGLVDDDNTGRDAGTIKQVGRQTDDALDITLIDDGLADGGLCIAAEQNAVRKNDRSLAGAFQGLQDMEKPRKVAVFFGRSVTIAVKTAIILKAVRPVFQRERGVGHRKVEALQHLIVGTVFKIVGRGECVSCLDLTSGLIVQDEVHLGKTGSSHFLLLSPNGNLKGSFIRCANQKRTGAAGRVIHGVPLISFLNAVDANHFGKNTGDFGRCIELALAFTTFRGEITHQIFIGVAKNIVSAGLVLFEIEFIALENGDQTGELVHHFFAAAQLGFIIEMGIVDHTAEIVLPGFCQLGNDFVHFFADVFIALQGNQIVETAAFRNSDIGIFYTLELVRNILYEQ